MAPTREGVAIEKIKEDLGKQLESLLKAWRKKLGVKLSDDLEVFNKYVCF